MSNVAALARMDEQMPVVKHTKAFHRQQFIHTHPYLLDPIHRFYSMHRSVINSLKYQYNRQKSNVDEGLADLITKVHLADPQSQSLLKAWVKAYVKSPEPYQRLDGQGLLAVAKEINGSKDMAQKIYRMLCSHKTQESDGPKALQQAFQADVLALGAAWFKAGKGASTDPIAVGWVLRAAQEKAQQRVQLYQIDRLSYRDQLSKLESICGGPACTHLVSKSMLDHLDQKSELKILSEVDAAWRSALGQQYLAGTPNNIGAFTDRLTHQGHPYGDALVRQVLEQPDMQALMRSISQVQFKESAVWGCRQHQPWDVQNLCQCCGRQSIQRWFEKKENIRGIDDAMSIVLDFLGC